MPRRIEGVMGSLGGLGFDPSIALARSMPLWTSFSFGMDDRSGAGRPRATWEWRNADK